MSDDVRTEDLEGELLPERTAMSLISTEPMPPIEEGAQTPPITEDQPPTE
jgi:hypothetical protein